MSKMINIIFDCDNTMGIKGRPMDDALAFFYLLGNKHIANVIGITTTFGNGSVEEVYNCTKALISEIKLDIPVKKGSNIDEDPKSDAAQFIVDTVNKNIGEVSVLAVGSMTNLYGAYLIDNDIFNKIKDIVLMGGITKELIVHGKVLNELNFSCNYKATKCVLENAKDLSIITGNNCLDAYLPREEFKDILSKGSKGGEYILQNCISRFDYKIKKYGADGSYCWDVVSAAYLLKPELFEDCSYKTFISNKNLSYGFLEKLGLGENGVTLNIPKINNLKLFKKDIYTSWNKFL